MDIGKFKTNKVRLTLWILIPPLLIVGMGLSSFALRLQSEWQLNRTRLISEVLPELLESRKEAEELMAKFNDGQGEKVQTEDELISFLQNVAGKAGFTVDSLKVDRRPGSMPVLVAMVKGSGSFQTIETYLSDVAAQQHLLSETSLKISRLNSDQDKDLCRADIIFELVLFKTVETANEGV